MFADENLSEECRSIETLRVKNEQLLLNLVKMHLLFTLDLSGDNFEQLFDCKTGFERKKNSIRKNKDDGIFGRELTEEGICRMYVLIDYIIQDKNITQEGLFRKCGSAVRQQELKYKLSHGKDVDLESGLYTVHDCANALKACLADLPQPLLTDAHFKLHCQIAKFVSPTMSPNTKQVAEQKRLKILQLLLLLLSPSVRKFVKDLLILLYKVKRSSEQNKMDSRSLATLFAPHLLCPKNMTGEDLQTFSSIMTDELQFMIENVNELFEPPKELVLDVNKELNDARSDDCTDGEIVHTVYAFCERDKTEEDYTQLQLAELYAHVHNMPDTPIKHKLIKQFNRQNGGKSPLVMKKSTPCKKAIKSIGNQLRKAGQNIFSRSSTKEQREEKSSMPTIKQIKKDCTEFLKTEASETIEREGELKPTKETNKNGNVVAFTEQVSAEVGVNVSEQNNFNPIFV
ncbi:rho GTPase-activating protein 19-like protein [Dinothrombium tinctorium]|uniref:Rho GTPase-activating protein 19-like protein n=1 Tax=Dinothrombium tinctorium TaxID=1965070 RepID=A0A443RP37_9ACAR|nr:rho GTPase-activating protein 19-like protein [Dinothrombium tinctorium]